MSCPCGQPPAGISDSVRFVSCVRASGRGEAAGGRVWRKAPSGAGLPACKNVGVAGSLEAYFPRENTYSLFKNAFFFVSGAALKT